MKIPSPIYGAIGGAAAASLAWLLFSPSAHQQPVATKESTANAQQPPVSAITKRQGLVASKQPTNIAKAPTHLASNAANDELAGAEPVKENSPPQNKPLSKREETRQERPEPIPPRDELIARAVIVEEQANNKLQILTSRLGLTEQQQDRIFPILASSSPAFHPILQPEGGIDYLQDSVFGDRKAIEPGASVAEVENEIYPVLDAEQKASLEEKAMDREAWWDDIVALLEEELDQPEATVATVQIEDKNSAEKPQPTDNQNARESSATVNEIDDFSSLLKGN